MTRLGHRLTRDPARITAPVEARRAIIDAVDGDTVDVRFTDGGRVVSGVSYLSSYDPSAGDRVWLLKVGTTLIVLGDVA